MRVEGIPELLKGSTAGSSDTCSCSTNSRGHLNVNYTFTDSPEVYKMTSGAFLRKYFPQCDPERRKSRLYMSFPRVFSRDICTISGGGGELEPEEEQGNRNIITVRLS